MTNSSTEKIIYLPAQISAGDLAQKVGLPLAKIMKLMMDNGIIAGVNDLIDYDLAAILLEEIGFQVQPEKEKQSEKDDFTLEKLREILAAEKAAGKNLQPRPPVVTVLGHVDHGKTTLLDTLRQTKIAEKEAGGITQHISSYQVKQKNKLITFIDTPGHEAFQAMRERGAAVADIAILVVAADDGVKPQTEEVISFLLEKKVPTVVAINKIDKPNANVNKVKQELAEKGLLLEGYGGDVPFNEISAKKNIGLDALLETVLLLAEINDLRADYQRDALGVVLEARKDTQRGPLANVIIKTGTLRTGQYVTVNDLVGKVRRLEDYAGRIIKEAPPSTPVTVFGLPAVPRSNDVLRASSKKIKRKKKGEEKQAVKHSLDAASLLKNIKSSFIKKYPIVLKADTQGSLEAVEQILQTIKSDEIALNIIAKNVGPITEKDVQTAQSGQAVVYGFNVFPTTSAKQLAKKSEVLLKNFNIIYELIEDVKKEMSDRLDPEIKRTDLGQLQVLAIFKNSKKGMIVGGKVLQGRLVKGEKLEVKRGEEIIGQGELTQLQHNKEDVNEVKENLECGLAFTGKTKIKVGDRLICYREEKIPRKI